MAQSTHQQQQQQHSNLITQWLDGKLSKDSVQEQKRQLTIGIKNKERELLQEVKQLLKSQSSEQTQNVTNLAQGIELLQQTFQRERQLQANTQILSLYQNIVAVQKLIHRVDSIMNNEEEVQRSFGEVQGLLNQIDEFIEGIEGQVGTEKINNLRYLNEMKSCLSDLKNQYHSKIKEINSLFISLQQDHLSMRSSALPASLQRYFTSQSLLDYLLHAILPLLKVFKLQITTTSTASTSTEDSNNQSSFKIKLIKRDLEDENDKELKTIDFVQVLLQSLRGAFLDNPMFIKDVMQGVIQELKEMDPQLVKNFQRLQDPLINDILQPLLSQRINPLQKQTADLLDSMESSIKSQQKKDFDQWLDRFQKELTKVQDPQKSRNFILLQVMCKYYYLQKDLLKNQMIQSLKVWNLSRKFTELLYQLESEGIIEITGDVEKLLTKIDKKLIKLQYTRSIDYYDQKIHDLIRSLGNLEQLESKKVAVKVQGQVNVLMQSFRDFEKLCEQWVDREYYRKRIIKQKFVEYLHLIIAQIFTDINDISIESNDELNKILEKMQEIPQIFANQFISLEELQEKYKEVRKLKELQDLFVLGLRDISDKVIRREIYTFTYGELERIVEARFENTQLRESLLKSMMKALKK